jgi:hypothetical protein
MARNDDRLGPVYRTTPLQQHLGERQLDAISCPAVSLCMAGDWEGNVITSTDPAGGRKAWKIAYVDDNSTSEPAGGPNQASISNVSCPSVSLCIGSDEGGD